jgi:hypothetical protein
MSYACIAHVLAHSRQTGNAKLLLVAIAEYADDNGQGATPSIATLARIIGTGERNVQLLLRKLEHTGELICDQGVGPSGCNRYTVCVGDPQFSGVVHPGSPEGNHTSPEEGESIFTQRKDGWKEGGSVPAPGTDPEIPLPPVGEPALPATPVALWEAARTACRPADLHQLAALANEHDESTNGAGRYWVGRAILAATCSNAQFATMPRALNLVRAILALAERGRVWLGHPHLSSSTPGART